MLVWIAILAVGLGAALFVLDWTFLLVPVSPGDASNAPTIGCEDRALAEGLTYRIRSPRRGELVAFHADRSPAGTIVPNAQARQLVVVRRIVGVPGDQVVARNGRVFVNGFAVDSIRTQPFKAVTVPTGEYFVLGDNRAVAEDSRDFGPVPRDAIFGRVVIVLWPIRDFGGIPARKAGAPPGAVGC